MWRHGLIKRLDRVEKCGSDRMKRRLGTRRNAGYPAVYGETFKCRAKTFFSQRHMNVSVIVHVKRASFSVRIKEIDLYQAIVLLDFEQIIAERCASVIFTLHLSESSNVYPTERFSEK